LAQADLKTAEIDLDHAYLKAPISGRVSRAEITVGNFVGSGASAPVLASIVSEDGIYADFEVDEQTYLDTIRDAANGNAQEETIPVQLVIPEDPERVLKGFVQNFDNRLNSSSGTIRARARFDNSDGSLVPGMFVSVRLASSQERKLILVNEEALRESGIAYVFLGKELGARTEGRSCYHEEKVQYGRLAQTELFHHGLDRAQEGAKKYRIALMYAEKDTLVCHRTILVARHLETLGLEVRHIHGDGQLETHADAMRRLLRRLNLPEGDMFSSREEIVAEAYRLQEERVAYSASDGAPDPSAVRSVAE
jgi:hypothetical protein